MSKFNVTFEQLRNARMSWPDYNILVRYSQGRPFTDYDEQRAGYIDVRPDTKISLVEVMERVGFENAIRVLRNVDGALGEMSGADAVRLRYRQLVEQRGF